MNLAFKTGDYVKLSSDNESGHVISVRYETQELLVSLDEFTINQASFNDVNSVNGNTIIVS